MDQPIVCERSEDNHDYEFVNTDESEHIHIQRYALLCLLLVIRFLVLFICIVIKTFNY